MKYLLYFLIGVALLVVASASESEDPETKYGDSEDRFEGDIIKTKGEDDGTVRNALNDHSKRWPKVGSFVEVPYIIHEYMNDHARKTIMASMKDFARWTCVKWTQRSNQKDYVQFQNSYGCASEAGKKGGKQAIVFEPNCFAQKGISTHEMMHALGFLHEQSRSDRNSYVQIIESNIKQTSLSQFKICDYKRCTLPRYPYDYNSVLHYRPDAFSRNGQDTIVPYDSSKKIGQRKGMSELDIKKINEMYNCGGRTVESNYGLTIPAEELVDLNKRCPARSQCANPFDNYQYLRDCEKTCEGIKKGDKYDGGTWCTSSRCNEAVFQEQCSYTCSRQG